MGAIAGVVATVLTLLTYVLPREPSVPPPASGAGAGPSPGPDPTTPDRARPDRTPPDQTTTPTADATKDHPVTRTPRPPAPGRLPSLAPLQPAGCEEALAVVDRFYRTSGSTRQSRQAAATTAYQGMMGASLQAEGGVHQATVALSQDFSELRFILSGMVASDYEVVQARTDRDAQHLRDVCDAG
ncbi:hypothetical protein OG989_01315 [Micromonospora sp. NBC_01740]|uniref:hypothetical protein n=1 Tax=Micromonospora sp. NBC_01740 TaxID=2975986 RepID=UPI002E113516|nr:hypothetical protein OG989_01315 [Micromonospora sp. NBC_01740]